MSRQKITGKGWTAYPEDPDRWVLRFYEGGQRKKHRIPQQVTDAKVRRYAEVYLVERLRKDRGTGKPPLLPDRTINPRITFQQFGELWTDGILAKMFPNRIGKKKSANSDVSRLVNHVYPLIGQIQVRAFEGAQGVEWAEGVLRRISKPATARQAAQAISRILTMAAFPGIRLIPHSPLPKGFVPPIPKRKAMSYLYPAEEARLMANTEIDLHLRMYFGFSIREGGRLGNFLTLKWRQVDLESRFIRLDETKTDEALSWVMGPDVIRALRRYKATRDSSKPNDFVFLDADENMLLDGKVIHRSKVAPTLRVCLKRSGIDRAELFEHTENRIQLRAHDFRGAFVTVKLANDKSETWVMDRTGHTTSQMLNKYRRAARNHREADLGDFVPLHRAVPELNEAEDDDENRTGPATGPAGPPHGPHKTKTAAD